MKSLSLGPSEFGGVENLAEWETLGASEQKSNVLRSIYATNTADESSGAEIVTERVV